MMVSIMGGAIVAWQTLRTHKLRSALTCLSLAIAVLALVMVDASSQVAADAVVAQARLTQGMPQTWQLDVPTGSVAYDRASRAFDVCERILRPNGGSVAVVSQTSGELNGAPVAVVAVLGDLRSIRPFRITSGSWLSQQEPANVSPEIVLGRGASSLAKGLVSHVALPGVQGEISGRVVGVVDDWAPMATIYLRFSDVALWTDTSLAYWTRDLLAHSPEGSTDIGQVLKYAAAITQLEVTPTRIDNLGATSDTLEATRTIFLLIAGVALVVGVLGILNIGLVSLRERTEEIALRRATGATRIQIGSSVLEESVLAAVVSAVIAILVAWFLVPFVSTSLFPNLPLVDDVGFPYQTALAGIVIAALAGLAGGIIPATRAAFIDIASVMRA